MYHCGEYVKRAKRKMMKQSRIDIKARSQRRVGEIGMMYIDIKVVMLYMINSFSVDKTISYGR